jgi:hypothetical protein
VPLASPLLPEAPFGFGRPSAPTHRGSLFTLRPEPLGRLSASSITGTWHRRRHPVLAEVFMGWFGLVRDPEHASQNTHHTVFVDVAVLPG